MTDRPDENGAERHPIARQVRELPAVEADAAFRERLREAFTSGQMRASDNTAPSPDLPASPEPPPRPSRRVPRILLPLAAALAAVIVVFIVVRTPGVEVLDVIGDGVVRVDGHDVQARSRERLERSIRSGARVELGPDVTLDLIVAGTAVYELAAGTRMTIPPVPGQWFGRAVQCSLFVGEMRLRSGPRFAGSELTVYTPDGVVVVTGTLLSVAVDQEGTCVCVLEGTASVGVNQRDLEEVVPGYRKIMMKSGEVSIIPVKPMHRDGVVDFDARIGDRLER